MKEHAYSKEKEDVALMFDKLSKKYDRHSWLISLGLLPYWRSRLIKELQLYSPKQILDVATGTADLAIRLVERIPSVEHVTGVDISEGMLVVGREKVAKRGYEERITLEVADALALPYGESSFDAVTCSFGVRNFSSLEAPFRQFYRVLRDGGTFIFVELSVPRKGLLASGHHFFTHQLLPLFGQVIAKNRDAYTYLFRSIEEMPQYEAMTAILTACGFRKPRYAPISGGIATLFVATK